MKIEQANEHYPLYTRWITARGTDVLLVARHADIESREATSMIFIDLDKQEQMQVDFKTWHNAVSSGSTKRIYPKL